VFRVMVAGPVPFEATTSLGQGQAEQRQHCDGSSTEWEVEDRFEHRGTSSTVRLHGDIGERVERSSAVPRRRSR